MFEIFVALFGGLYYGTKYIGEKAERKKYDNEIAEWQKLRDDLRSRYAANLELEHRMEEMVLSGEHFDDICKWFADDFRYALGENWKETIRIPPNPMLSLRMSIKDAYDTWVPANHTYWVIRLLLAKQGKMPQLTFGEYLIGGLADKDMNIRFAECIEKHLLKAGVQGVRLALELKDICIGVPRTPDNVCGGRIVIESLSSFPTHRLWDDCE